MKPGSHLFSPISFQESTPLYRQLYERVRRAISVGLLFPGDRLPSARMLAKELGVARGTIEQAYSLLIAEGYLQAHGQAGTRVNPDLPSASLPLQRHQYLPQLQTLNNRYYGVHRNYCPFKWAFPLLTPFRANCGLDWVHATFAACNYRIWITLRLMVYQH